MILSLSSLITILLISNLSILLVYFLLNKHNRILQICTNLLLLGILLLLFRLFIPFEFSFQRTISEKQILPKLFMLLYFPIINFNGYNLYVFHVLLFTWLCGIMIFATRKFSAYIKFKRLIKKEPRIDDEIINDLINSISKVYGKARSFCVIKTNLVSVPLLFGIFKPYIILPEVELSNKELYYIIKHEVTHYYHYDIWIKWYVEIIAIIYWWNPLVYILRQQVEKLLEIRVDTSVTKQMNALERIHYLECILSIAKEKKPLQKELFLMTFGSKTASLLSQRFNIVLDTNTEQKSIIRNAILFIMIVLILVSASVVVLEPYSITPEDQNLSVELTAETAFLVQKANGEYDIYLNHKFFGTVSKLKDSYLDLPIYKNIKGEFCYENQK